jgi:hypothetical protein
MSEESLLRAQMVALQSRVERVEYDLSQIMSDMNIEKGHRKLFRVFAFLFFILVVGMFAWTQFENREFFAEVLTAIKNHE